MQIGDFLCGCDIKTKRGYFHDIDDKGRSVTSRTDEHGFDVCPEHGERRYGWRSEVSPMRGGSPRSTGELNLPLSTVDDKRPHAPQMLLAGKSLAEVAQEEIDKRGIHYGLALGDGGGESNE